MADYTNHRAVVVGGSIGGLLAARILSESFASVTVVDRDRLPDREIGRRGVPQGHHPHALLARGREILDELFPGLTGDLVARGAVPVDVQNDVRSYHDGWRLRQAPSDLHGVSVSRPALEGYLRSRVAALPGVVLRTESEVTGLLADDTRSRVTGVRALVSTFGAVELPADLVVDATGRGNRGATWLTELGYEPTPQDEVETNVVYASRDYRRSPSDSDVAGIVVGPTIAVPRGGVALAAEGDRWMVTLYGMGKDAPPADHEGFTDFAARLPVPELHQLIQTVEPISEVRRMRIPTSIRRRYERLDRFPDGLIVFGDALCQFNPTYAQGMTVAASEAIVLRESLQHGTRGLARRFFRQAARVVDVAWDMSTGADLRFPSVRGNRPARVRFVNAYAARVQAAAAVDPVVGYAFLSVANLTAPPQKLFSPGILARVLRTGRPAPRHTVADTSLAVEP
ncbi:FAD-dependent monooxygenase [Micromonospora sp. R77]|uniref:FAD-dependent oxidoreductase n=1 Tax=Micromonospora sp. R77 TaxID=2925836 RepID=UPI001F6061E4|nr:FAD-dependent monooxygenase [Micromonospora sp. R77]MCI4066151.1 FAD-dependent monooxygenase [Micromonospora sp. R77]